MKRRKSIKNIGKYLTMFVMAYIMLVTTAFTASATEIIETHNAADTKIVTLADKDGWGAITSWLTTITSNVKTIGYVIAGLAVIALGIIFITGGGQALQKGKGMAVAILVGVAVLSFGTSLIGSLQG